MPAKKPVHKGPHKLQKIKWGKDKTEVFKCMLADCPTYFHIEMTLGRKSLCHKCGREFIMTKEKLLRMKPKCDSCIRGRNDSALMLSLDSLLEDL